MKTSACQVTINWRQVISLLTLILWLSACAQAPDTPTPSPVPPTETPTLTPMATSTPSPTPTPTPCATPTPSPLSPGQIFDLVSPAVAFVETLTGSGSGLLIEGDLILTNAHVIRPHDTARVVFPDGTEHTEVQLIDWDLMGDLALLGPIETDIEPVTLVYQEAQIVGAEVYLIGYPGEVDEFPQPTIARGLVSRLREWEPIGVTFFQTDAAIAPGQSGGVLVSEMGEVVGISGSMFGMDFGLAASTADLIPRIEALLDGTDVDGLGDRRMPLEGGKFFNRVQLEHQWDHQLFVVNEPIDTRIHVEVEGENDAAIFVWDPSGFEVTAIDDTRTGGESGSFTIEDEGPYFVTVEQFDGSEGTFFVQSDHLLARYEDRDDGQELSLGEVYRGNLDFPGDFDWYRLVWEPGPAIHLLVDTISIDPFLVVGNPWDEETRLITDDDTGGGLYGENAELVYQPLRRGTVFILVGDAFGYSTGGYLLSVDGPGPDSPTPIVPEPTPTPIVGIHGVTALYTSPDHPFSIEYPADWNLAEGRRELGPFGEACRQMPVCKAGLDGVFTLVSEDVGRLGQATLAEVVDVAVVSLESVSEGIELVSREQIRNSQGIEAEVVTMSIADGQLFSIQLICVESQTVYVATYVVAGEVIEELRPMIDYSFSSFLFTDR